ncbi:hypothetical protein ACNKHQ_00350 [Shigella flexneri]
MLVNTIETGENPARPAETAGGHALWKAHPNLQTPSEAWILAGGAHQPRSATR